MTHYCKHIQKPHWQTPTTPMTQHFAYSTSITIPLQSIITTYHSASPHHTLQIRSIYSQISIGHILTQHHIIHKTYPCVISNISTVKIRHLIICVFMLIYTLDITYYITNYNQLQDTTI